MLATLAQLYFAQYSFTKHIFTKHIFAKNIISLISGSDSRSGNTMRTSGLENLSFELKWIDCGGQYFYDSPGLQIKCRNL
jgi:hypothetical protein